MAAALDPALADASSRRVLVVEDDDNIATALEYVVHGAGLACARAASGDQALAMLRDLRPDLILLDIMLPGPSGYDICDFVRQAPRLQGVRVLMMTARGSAQEQRRALDHGADGFISKPFDLGTLRAEMGRLLGR
jgi:two-component system phosphate regulon response regulator PhoB